MLDAYRPESFLWYEAFQPAKFHQEEHWPYGQLLPKYQGFDWTFEMK